MASEMEIKNSEPLCVLQALVDIGMAFGPSLSQLCYSQPRIKNARSFFDNLSLLPKRIGRTPFQFSKCLGKVTHLLKSTFLPNVRNFPIRTKQHLGGFLNPELFDILDWRIPDHIPETSQAFTFADMGAFCNLQKRNFLAVMLLNVLQHDFGTLAIPQVFFGWLFSARGWFWKRRRMI